jgi:hypothetical protein
MSDLIAELIAMESANLADIKSRECAVEVEAARMRNGGVFLTPFPMNRRALKYGQGDL